MRSSRRCSLVFVASFACVVPARTSFALDVSGEADYGARAAASSWDDAPLVRLSLIDLYGLTLEAGAGASGEAAALLDRLGARVQVRSRRPSEAHDPRDLQVVVMPGDPGPLLARTVLGAIQRDAPTRALWVFPRTIAAALGLTPDPAGWTPVDRARFATALGRVVAHEVVHLTCPWRDHDRSGLMAARMSRATLRGEALDLEDELRRDFVLGAAARGGSAGRASALTHPPGGIPRISPGRARGPAARLTASPSLSESSPLTRNSAPPQRPPMASRGPAR